MKVYVFSCVLLLMCFCSCSHADAGMRGAAPPSGGMGVVSEDLQQDRDEEFDQEVLAESMGRRKFQNMSPGEIVEEIKKLVSQADSNGDGKLNKQEIVACLKRSEDRSYREEADSLFEQEDKDGDGLLSFAEFFETMDGEGQDVGKEVNEAQGGVKTRFDKADANADGKLNAEEFAPFVHPFRHEHMVDHLLEDQLMIYDRDHDGRISLHEYIDNFDPEREDGAVAEEGGDWAEEHRVEFEEHLDKNKDGFLNHQEIKDWVAPNEMTFFEQEAQHLLSHADQDKDGALTVKEIEAELDIFVESPLTDYGHSVHDEL